MSAPGTSGAPVAPTAATPAALAGPGVGVGAGAGAGTGGMVVSAIPPNQTLYINNLNDKVRKRQLKKSLYAVFSQFGKIVDIVAIKTKSLRGQAWVAFEDVASSTTALRQMQGFPFYDKPLRIQFAKEKSDAVAKADGSYVPKAKRVKLSDEEMAKKAASAAAAASAAGDDLVLIPAPPPKVSHAPPNKILFAENLPAEVEKETLVRLFEGFGGFKEVRLIKVKHVAFVEFDHESSATIAMQAMNNHKLNATHFLALNYAKK